MMLTRLEWDSNFFGFPVGVIELGEERFDSQVIKEVSNEVKLVYVTSKSEIHSGSLSCGDTKVVFSKKPVQREFPKEVIEASVDWLEQMQAIGRQSGIWSRFALDPNIDRLKFEQMYDIWVERSLKREISHRTLTVLTNGHPSGIITLDHDVDGITSIGLFAVAKEHRGVGIGSKLLSAADSISFAKGDQELRVATQGKNRSACAVYEHFGFSRFDQTYIYNYWNEAFTVQ